MIHLAIPQVGREHVGGIHAHDMSDEEPTPVSLRLASYIIKEADALIPKVTKDKSSHLSLGGKVTRTDVLRLAIIKGLADLKKSYESKG